MARTVMVPWWLLPFTIPSDFVLGREEMRPAVGLCEAAGPLGSRLLFSDFLWEL